MRHRNYIKTLLEPLKTKVYDDFLTTKNIPKDYLIVRAGLFHNNIYSDGRILLKKPYCRVDVFSEGIASYELADRVEEALKEVNPNRVNVGYLEDVKRTQVTFEFYLI